MSGSDKRPGPAYLPGDPTPPVDAMIRVDHAGEFGAVRIYEGQLAVLPPGPARDGPFVGPQERRAPETARQAMDAARFGSAPFAQHANAGDTASDNDNVPFHRLA